MQDKTGGEISIFLNRGDQQRDQDTPELRMKFYESLRLGFIKHSQDEE